MSDQPSAPPSGPAQSEALAVLAGDTGFTMSALAQIFVQSGFFRDVKSQAQGIIKVLYGKELGLSPIAAMLSINMVEGRPEVAAATLGALVKRSGKYDYRIVALTDDGCEIEFFEKNGQLTSVGKAKFTLDDAEKAGLAKKFNYRAYPQDMMFARALSRGVKRFCLDAVGTVPVYVTGEISDARAAQADAGEVIDATAEEVKDVNPFASTKKEPVAPADAEGLDPKANPSRGEEARAAVEPKARKARASKQSPAAAGENPGGDFGASGAPVAGESAPPPIGSEDCETEGCWGPRAHEGDHVFEADAASLKTPPAEGATGAAGAEPGPTSGAVVEGPQTFTVGNAVIETAGMTEAQFVESLRLATAIDKGPLGRGYARGLLAKMLHVPVEQASRKNLDQAMGEKYLAALRQAATAGSSQQEIKP